MEVINHTPYLLERMVALDKRAAEHLIVVLKATYLITEQGALSLAEEQDPIREADEFYSEPDSSSTKHEAELGPVKPATDVFLKGSALAERTGIHTMFVSFRLGSMSKTAVVFGERFWKKSFGRAIITAPKAFESVPLTYENAYGGQDMSAENPNYHRQEPMNPVGRGFRSKRSKTPWVDTLLPNIEDPNNTLRRPAQKVDPVGFGPIGRNWKPRVDYAGTYDQKWIDERMPLLPEDFDERFHNAAPPYFVSNGYLKGGAPVEVTGCTKSGRLGFMLPKIEPCVLVRVCDRAEDLRLEFNSVTVDTDKMELRLLWKGDLYVHREVPKIKEIECRVEGELQ